MIILNTVVVFFSVKRRNYVSTVISFSILCASIYFAFEYDFGEIITNTLLPRPLEYDLITKMVGTNLLFATVFEITSCLSIKKVTYQTQNKPLVSSNALPNNVVLGLTILVFYIVISPVPFIFEPYPYNYQLALVQLEGASVIFQALLAYYIVKWLALSPESKAPIFILIFLLLHSISIGSRSTAIFYSAIYLWTFYLRFKLSSANLIKLLTILIAAFYVLYMTPTWRTQQYVFFPESNTGSVDGIVESFFSELTGFNQAAAHSYLAIQFVQVYGTYSDIEYPNSGIFGMLLQIIIQIIPSQIIKLFGFELYSGSLALSEYYVHGGGFFIPAETYFLGGFGGVIFFATYFGLMSRACCAGLRRSNSPLLFTVSLVALGASVYGVFYGVQALNRIFSVPLLLYTFQLFRHIIKKT